MKIKYLWGLLALAFIIAARLWAADPVQEVAILANDQMKFSLTQIEARPGQTIHVTLNNTGTMPKAVMGHNWILLKAGKDPVAYANAAISAAGENYQPKALADQVIASIRLLGPKQDGETTFMAPVAPGTYYYLCSFPAHCQAGMRGKLIVK
jgi:azurin